MSDNKVQFKKSSKLRKLTKGEKWTQRIIIAGAVTAGLVFWDKIIPFLIRITENTIYLVAALSVLGLFVFLITDPKIRALAKAGYMKAISSLTRLFVKNDPIGIMKIYMQQLKSRQREMEKDSNLVASEKGRVDRIISDQFEEMKIEIAKSRKSEEIGEIAKSKMHKNQAGRLKMSNEKLKKMSDRMFKLQIFLNKLSKNTSLMVQDRENSLRTKEMEYRTLKAAHKALSNATEIFNGKNSEKDLYEDALKFLQEDMGSKIGEIDNYLEKSQDFILNMDIESAIFDEEGEKVLDQLLNKDFEYLFQDPENDFQKITNGKHSADELLKDSKQELSYGKQDNINTNPYI